MTHQANTPQAYVQSYTGSDESAAEQFRRLADILVGFRPVFIAPTLLNSWVNYGGSVDVVGYYKDPLGRVHLKGTVKNGVSAVAFTLPEGYRPIGGTLYFPAISTTAAVVITDAFISVGTNGNVSLFGGSPDLFSLSGISFVAA